MLNQVSKEVVLIGLQCLILNLMDYVAPLSKFDAYKPLSEQASLNNITVNRYFEKRKDWLTSNLGSMLFKNQHIQYHEQDRIFTVLVWKHPYWSKWYIIDPLTSCSVKNCIFTSSDRSMEKVDVILVTLYKNQIPWGLRKYSSKIWVFLSNESPVHNFGGSKPISKYIEPLANVFNWSMTYRSDSDVPIPYGRTVPLSMDKVERISTRHITEIIPHWESKQRDVLVIAMISNCRVPERMQYLEELQNYIKVDLIGGCAKSSQSKSSCPRHKGDCPKLNKYLFYLAFENSRCRQYISEKVYFNAFTKGAIPVVMGAPISDYEKLLPPHSFLHVNSFYSPRDLAIEIVNLSMNDDFLALYHMWRYHFEVVNDHGSFGYKTLELCRLCQALNFNKHETKVYDLDTLKLFLEPKILCTKYIEPNTSLPAVPSRSQEPKKKLRLRYQKRNRTKSKKKSKNERKIIKS